MTTSVLTRPFGVDRMIPAGEVVNGVPTMATQTEYTTTYVRDVHAARTQVKDDEHDAD